MTCSLDQPPGKSLVWESERLHLTFGTKPLSVLGVRRWSGFWRSRALLVPPIERVISRCHFQYVEDTLPRIGAPLPCPLIGWSFLEAVGDAKADERKNPTSAKLCDFMVKVGRRILVNLTGAGVAYFPNELPILYLYMSLFSIPLRSKRIDWTIVEQKMFITTSPPHVATFPFGISPGGRFKVAD